ncbi:MAG: propionyl-CoA carboxylase [Gammaproteobacteria bacterium AqS3]|nr:propionyl-CoA carboxylase [Gammaproteobacteria bacterium AqS3]
MSWEEEAEGIRRRRDAAQEQGGAQAVERHHSLGRLTVRERIDLLTGGDFDEMGRMTGSGEVDDDGALVDFTPANYVLGTGRVGERRAVIGGEDFTLKGGSPNAAGLRKSVYSEDMALRYRLPLVRLLEGGGGSVAGTSGRKNAPVGEAVSQRPRFLSIARVLSEVPVASAALGPVAGFPAARLAASHLSVMTRATASVMAAGPAVVERALGIRLSKDALGGERIHRRSGLVDVIVEDEAAAMRALAEFLSYLPPSVHELPPRSECGDDPGRCEDELIRIVPRSRREPYDMRRLIAHIVDDGRFFEIGRHYGREQICALARFDGHAAGVYANDCRHFAGAMTAAAGQKARRFVDFCSTFHLPVVALVDQPGFMIGPEAEAAGTLRYGAAAIAAVMESPVPWCSVIVRKVFGVAGAAHFAPDAHVLAWPSAESGALPVEGGVAVAFGREIAAADDPKKRREELEELLGRRQSSVFARGESFAYHDLIDPRETRPQICSWLRAVQPLMQSLKGPVRFGWRP